MSVEMYNDDLLVSGENIFKKAIKGIKSGIKNAYKSGSTVSIDKSGINVVDKPQPQIVVSNPQSQVSDMLKNPMVLGGIGLVAVFLLMGNKKGR